jgi:ATP-dependent helicase/nuclease subunit A
MSDRDIPPTVLAKQHKASDPGTSAWVSANAGSGKTYVLAQRVIRLLLEGTDPAKILCLTFTKAAAANMANQVFSRLAEWTTLDDPALEKKIRETGVKQVDPDRRARARQLFAAALDTPGGLKVQTIHAFCTRLLQQFPFEARVAARFEVLEETEQRRLIEDLRLRVLLAAAAEPDSAGGRALATIIERGSDAAFATALDAAIRERDKIAAWLDHAGGIEGAKAALSHALAIDAADTLEAVERAFFEASLIPMSEWQALIAVLATGTVSDKKQAERLAAVQSATDEERLDAYLAIFCTTELKARSSLVTKAIRDGNPKLFQSLLAEQQRVCALLDRRRAVLIRERTVALLTLAAEVIEGYRSGKERRGLLDYADLIAKARELLTRVEAAWVHYKLDLGIDHLLIDEAQDTSPEQWDIIRQLTAEFTAGAGARGTLKRSIFAVGDDKQSIFSFQGAAPREFDAMRRGFRQTFQAAEMSWEDVRLDYSFRSGENVLAAVQRVFEARSIYRSVTSDEDGFSPHQALPDAAPGLVEIWEPEKQDPKAKPEGWDAPFDKTSSTSSRVVLANRIANAVQRWIDRGERVGTGKDRHPMRPGDVLILVRQRGPLFEAIIRGLKNKSIAVAGADRLVLTEHIAVMDLLVLADALLLADDDLALATALKSPLFGISEDDLFNVAWNRKGTLRAALAARRPEIAARLDAIADDARALTPFAFYAKLLGPRRGRRQFLSRLGGEANDALDEFLNLALDYETHETPSLQGFLAWLRTAAAEIKRDMEITRDEVRVMTVHGAKGLEAPIVILADTMTPPEGPAQHQPRLIALPVERAVPGAPAPLAWIPSKKDDTTPVADARTVAQAEATHEYRRLLYVAMTRAADRLIVCGALGEQKRPEGCWYDLVFGALKPHAKEMPAEDGRGTIWRFCKTEPADETTAQPAAEQKAKPTLPEWLSHDAPSEEPRPTPVSPSRAYDEQLHRRVVSAETVATRRKAIARGLAVHRLLQSLPDIPPARREDATRQYLARPDKNLTDEERTEIADHVRRLLDNPRFAELFAPGSRAEMPIVGRLIRADGTPILVSGQVDRLLVTEREILIADYKTNRAPPRSLAEALATHAHYIRQLALYRAVLSRVFPGTSVRAALVWTDVPELMEISASALDAEMAGLGAA